MVARRGRRPAVGLVPPTGGVARGAGSDRDLADALGPGSVGAAAGRAPGPAGRSGRVPDLCRDSLRRLLPAALGAAEPATARQVHQSPDRDPPGDLRRGRPQARQRVACAVAGALPAAADPDGAAAARVVHRLERARAALDPRRQQPRVGRALLLERVPVRSGGGITAELAAAVARGVRRLLGAADRLRVVRVPAVLRALTGRCGSQPLASWLPTVSTQRSRTGAAT